MKILFLLPPSEGKNNVENGLEKSNYKQENLSFNFEKPIDIAISATEKDLKCIGERYEEGIQLNQNIENSLKINAIDRYSGVMFKAIDFTGMSKDGTSFFQENFLILSGLYGLVKPMDTIANYKLPIETKGLYNFWGDKISQALLDEKPDYLVNLLPISYAKLIKNINDITTINKINKRCVKIININFLKEDGKKISHGVKKIKGERIKNICEQNITDFTKFGGKIVKTGNIIDINIIHKI